MTRTVNIGLIGAGTVGGGVVQALKRNGALMASRLGVRLRVTRVAVRSLRKKRDFKVPQSALTTDWREVVNDPKVNLVVELIGGTTTAKDVVLAALRAGKPVVTANKALLAFHGEKLFAAAEKAGANLYYEASVAGGVPIIKVIREALVGNRVTHLYGILNGTCNFILTKMNEGMEFDAAVKLAQQQGYAEADPTLDVGGHDVAHGFWVKPKQVYTEGIEQVAPLDLEFADSLGYAIKLLGIVKTSKPGPVQVSMYPALIPDDHVLANVSDVYNGILVRGDVVGDTLHYGQGAGRDATASAVLSDIGDAVLDLKHGSTDRLKAFIPHESNGAVRPIEETTSCYYLRLSVLDRPGVLAKVSAVLAKNKIGISSVIQPEGHEGNSVPLILMLHYAKNAAMQKALKEIRKLSAVKAKPVMIRVENFA